MDSRRRRNTLELEVQISMPAPDASSEAPLASQSLNTNGLGESERVEQQLEPADGGAAARKVLSATFMFEAVLFGEHSLSLHLTMATCMKVSYLLHKL